MLSFSSSHFLSICDTPSPELNTGVGSVIIKTWALLSRFRIWRGGRCKAVNTQVISDGESW